MTRRVNTQLARVRAAAKALRSQEEGGTETAVATIEPALAGTLADARAIIARELELMRKATTPMELKDAKKLQTLMSALSAAENIEKDKIPELNDLSDEELDAELKSLQSGQKKEGE